MGGGMPPMGGMVKQEYPNQMQPKQEYGHGNMGSGKITQINISPRLVE